MSSRILLIVLSVILSVTACSAPTPAPEPPKATSEPVVAAPATTVPPATDTPLIAPDTAAGTVEKAPATTVAAADPANPNRSCKTDADCAVKDVGNCCGAYPMCVNKDAHTDAAAVRAQCAKNGMASICGFREVRGCTCVQGQCQDIADGEVVM